MIEGEKEEKRERDRKGEREREREKEQNNVVEQLHFHLKKKIGDSGGPVGGNT